MPNVLCALHLRPGFLKCLQGILRLEADGLATCGVPCSSFIWMNSSTHQRTARNPFGTEENREYVMKANILVCRLALLLLVCLARSCYFQIEQPASSRLFFLPYMQYLFNLTGLLRIPFINGSF